MLDYLLHISLILVGLSGACYLFNIYGWRHSLMISGVGIGLTRIMIEAVRSVMQDANQMGAILLYIIIGLFILGILMCAVGVHIEEIKTYKELGIIRSSKQTGGKDE